MGKSTGKHNIYAILAGHKCDISPIEGTATANKAVVLDSNKAIDAVYTASLNIGTSGSETAVTATGAEINQVADASARIVTTTATALSLTVTEHADRIVLINTNSAGAGTFSLPAAAGTGAKLTLINNIAQTQGSIVIAANGTDVMNGVAMNFGTTGATAQAFSTSATSDKITLNNTTTGGEIPGDKIELWDSAANTWTVSASVMGSGTLATPFSATS